VDANLKHLPQDRESLEAMLRSLLVERDEQRLRAEQQRKRADELHLENPRLQLELVSRPGDLVSTDSSLGIGVGPAEGAGLLFIGVDVAAEFARQVGY
jgi:hypothetical protein